MEKQIITSSNFKGGLGGRAWSPALKVGPWLFVSGCVPHDNQTGKTSGRAEGTATTPGTIDPEAQWRQALTNVKDLVENAGGTMADVVMANVYVTDMHFYYQYEWIRKEFFVEPYPVSTAIEVGSLVHPDWIIEIEVTAYIEDE
jgi:enamine deaminase RidA (YjgF/YER057c/UK114 family)